MAQTSVRPPGVSAADFKDALKACGGIVGPEALPGRSAPATIEVVVYNDRHRQAQTFAAALSARGARAFAVQGDAGRLWYDRLRGLVRGGTRRIAGMTTHTDLFILETLARDEGLKVRHRDSGGGARLVSWVMT